MIGNIYRNNNLNGSSHSSKSLLKKAGQNEQNDYRSPFMYMHDDSTRTLFVTDLGGDQSMTTQCNGISSHSRLDAKNLKSRRPSDGELSSTYTGSWCSSSDDDDSMSGSSFGNDYSIDCSHTSFLVEDSDDLDELEKALEKFAAKEERDAAKEAKEAQKQAKKENRRRSLEVERPVHAAKTPARRSASDLTDLRRPDFLSNDNNDDEGRGGRRSNRRRNGGSDHDDNRSVGSNKSLPLSALEPQNQKPKPKTLSGSNRSLMSICPVKDQLEQVFGDTSVIKNVNWDNYFDEEHQQEAGSLTDELEKAIRSKKVKRLQRLHKRGVCMNARNKQGETVVSLVCRTGSAEMLMYLMTEAKVTVRVRDKAGKNPLHEIAWSPKFEPCIAMMLMSDSPELLWAPDARGFLALDYAPKRCQVDWYEFLELKQQMLKLSLQFSRFKASSMELNRNQERLRKILEEQLQSKSKSKNKNDN